jgi:hypothetical protein
LEVLTSSLTVADVSFPLGVRGENCLIEECIAIPLLGFDEYVHDKKGHGNRPQP